LSSRCLTLSLSLALLLTRLRIGIRVVRVVGIIIVSPGILLI